MKRITIEGVDLECDDNCEISIEGKKVTIKAAPVERVVHEHHYHYYNNSVTTVTPPPAPYRPVWIGDYPYQTWGTNAPVTFGNVSIGLSNDLGDPPATSGFVSVIPDGPGLLPSTGQVFAIREPQYQ
jgi:hypothetical protein